MGFISYFISLFSVIGAIDLIFGSRLGVGKEFQKGFMLLGNLALSMIGMIVLAPVIGEVMSPIFNFMYSLLNIDPSIFPSLFFANDMGGATLATSVAKNGEIGQFNGLVVSSMMGCTISFTIPYALTVIDEKIHKLVLLGFLCGIVTIPLGCIVSGVIMQVEFTTLLYDLTIIIIFSIIIALGLILVPELCVKILGCIGNLIKILIIIGLLLAIFEFLTNIKIINNLENLDNAAMICVNATVVMSGAFPFLFILSKVLRKPLEYLSQKLGINSVSAFCFISTLASSITTFENMKNMDEKGIVLNSAFAISASFIFADHLAFTMAFNHEYIIPVIVGKMVSGILAVFLAFVMYKNSHKSRDI